jgi:NDP-sugar pyrophosphorylase family protein
LGQHGVYVFDPACCRHIPRNQADLPELLQQLMAKTVHCRVHRDYWLDIGRAEDYEQVMVDWRLRNRFLPEESAGNGPDG